MINRGLGIYFFHDRIRLSDRTIEELDNPKYIHLLLDKKEKHLFIRASKKRDNDTFRVIRYRERGGWCYRIYSKGFVKYLAYLIGLPYPFNSVWYDVTMLEDRQTAFVDLNEYHIIPNREDTF